MAIFTVIKNTFIKFYENLFKLVLLDLVLFFLVITIIFPGYAGLASGWYIPIAIPIVLLGPIFLSGLHTMDKIVTDNEINYKGFFVGIKKYFIRGLLGFLYTFSVYLILIIDFFFFLQKSDNLLMLIIAIISFYLIIFFSMVQYFFWGLLTIQKEKKISIVIKDSLLITLDNAFFSFLWFIVFIILILILLITGVGFPLLFPGLTGLMISNGTRYVLEKYGLEGEGD